jgi:protein TilB
MQIPKFMTTALLDVDLHPNFVTIKVKDKYTQLEHPDPIQVEKSSTQRSQTTGALMLTMPKADYTEKEAQNARIKQKMQDRDT